MDWHSALPKQRDAPAWGAAMGAGGEASPGHLPSQLWGEWLALAPGTQETQRGACGAGPPVWRGTVMFAQHSPGACSTPRPLPPHGTHKPHHACDPVSHMTKLRCKEVE